MTRLHAAIKTILLSILGALHAFYLKARAQPIEAEAIFVAFILLVASLPDSDPMPESTDGRIIVSGEDLNVPALEETFAEFGYSLSKVREEGTPVPRLIVSRLPAGLKDIRVVDRRKRLFFRTVLPLVLVVNESIATARARLLSIASNIEVGDEGFTSLSAEDVDWLVSLAGRYGIDAEDENLSEKELVNILTLRVAPIPTSLALAQAVEESAWGTSRFAREGNALFGQWVWNEEEGIVPTDQREGQAYAVRAFDTPLDSVRAYAKNLNTHWAYTNFREQRAEMLKVGEALDGWVLAETLTRYSERGETYVDSLHAIMRVNKLRALDKAVLTSPDAMAQLADAS